MSPKPKPFEAFLAQRESGCMEWIGGTSRSNGRDSYRYGRYRVGGNKELAHRVAFERAKGPIPAGLVVRHTCGNTLCCNPEHLVLGTQQDNYQDAIRRGRADPRANGVASGIARRSN